MVHRGFSILGFVFAVVARLLHQSLQSARGMLVHRADRRYQARIQERFNAGTELLRRLLPGARHIAFQRPPPGLHHGVILRFQRREARRGPLRGLGKRLAYVRFQLPPEIIHSIARCRMQHRPRLGRPRFQLCSRLPSYHLFIFHQPHQVAV